MTIKLKVAVPEGKAVIVNVDLPTELAAGEWITGSITLRNDGGADTMALVLNTMWDNKLYGAVFDLAAGGSTSVGLEAGIIAMPNQDAVIDIYGCHAEPGGEFTIGGVEFKIDHKVTH